MPPSDLAHKGTAVEEPLDLRFFRPAGMRVVRLLAPSAVSADHVTVAALVVGLVAGHLFLYPSVALNALGLLLFIVSDILDSADGQLARLRGSSTRFGRILDGVADNLRFVNLYAHLAVRLALGQTLTPYAALGLAAAAGVSHSLQAGAADYIRQLYLSLAVGHGELDLPEDLTQPPGSRLGRLGFAVYRAYITRQARWFARSAALVRSVRRGGGGSALAGEWGERQAGVVRASALIAQNIRFLLLLGTACVGWPQGFLWLTLGPLNLVLIVVLALHERTAGRLGRSIVPATNLAPAGSG